MLENNDAEAAEQTPGSETSTTSRKFGADGDQTSNELRRRRDRRACDALLSRLCTFHPYTTAEPEIEPEVTVAPPPIITPIESIPEPDEPVRLPSVAIIIRETASHYLVPVMEINSQRRQATIVRPRQVAMYLAKTMTLQSLPEIGRRFGGRDHTTVLHAVRKIEGLVCNDAKLADQIEALKLRIMQATNVAGFLAPV